PLTQCSSDPHGEKAPLVLVNGTHTLLVSAYLEHRTGKREVSEDNRGKRVAYRCHLCCEGHNISTPLHISEGHASIHWDHFGFRYGTADIMCPIPPACETPSHVTVTSADPPLFLEVLNQEERKDSFPHNFTLCMSTMFDFTNLLQLVQSMEMLQLLGVSRVVIYKTSCDADTQRLLDYYTDKGFIEVIPWSMSNHLKVSKSWKPEIAPGDLHYYGQLPALNDCVYRYMYQSRYVAMHDVDELILPQSVDSWNDLMPLLEQKYGADKCYKFENYMFPHTFKLPPPVSETHHRLRDKENPTWQGISGVNILKHLYHEPYTNLVRSNFKVIINPRAVIETSVHGPLKLLYSCFFFFFSRPPMQTGLTPDKLIFDGRVLGYSARLIQAVNTVLREAGLIQKDSI
uniref:Glycosyltransferase family 92 protein n=1 Tax=Myripristis murdjan TaxID=586833 RepID=A0A667X7K8_9TELE